jgi:3-deoxy-D-manno-octulosonic-acid transferase/heptosyltransferase-1
MPYSKPARVLVVRLSAIGDVVRTLPAVLTIRRALPGAHLAWLVEDLAAGVLEGHPALDALWVVPRGRWREGFSSPARWAATLAEVLGFARRLRAAGFDWVIDFHGILKSGLWALATGAPVRVGYEAAGSRGWGSREGNRFFTNVRVDVPRRPLSRFERNAILARAVVGHLLGEPPEATAQAPTGALLHVAPEIDAEVKRFLRTLEAPGAGALVAIHPGSSLGTAYKRWFPERYGEVADALASRGHRVILTWGPGERDSVEAIARGMKHPAILAPETPTLQHLSAIFRRCALFIGNDTGPMHVAALSGTPVLVVFGPTDPVENAPYPGVPSAILRRDVACGCPKRECLTRACFDAVTADDVIDEALSLLRATRSGAP